MITCPICEEASPHAPSRCLCGYDFETQDPSRAVVVLRARLKTARRLMAGGIALLLSIPLTIYISVSYGPKFPFMVLIALPFQLGMGGGLLGSGFLRGYRDRRRLRAARERLQLPAARVIPR
ncbi:MAG: hypothetical protein ABI175_07055 [Polyangiales bacterium]